LKDWSHLTATEFPSVGNKNVEYIITGNENNLRTMQMREE
jgi:hypothetical protein